MDVVDFDDYAERWSRAHGGYDVRSSRSTRAWLRVAHRLASPLARRRVPPTWVTAVGGVGAVAVTGVAALGGRWPLLAAALVVVVALLDGVDGALAEMTDSTTAWGRVLDQLVDRIGDVAMVVGLWALGAPGPVCAAAAVLTVLDESIRSSASAAGLTEVGLVAVAERPVRLLLGGLALAAAGAVPSAAMPIVTAGAALWAFLSLLATVQLVVNVRRRLRGRPRDLPRTEDQGEVGEEPSGHQ
ncbi:CDP-alcohol phosphatidyltransferase family protein [Actinomycetospora cinnamomea]|uniref:CDP-diacylglycerol--glycerol-3-phosphate 3-phosphatidyltransferase n=1 Tax=Actinomycetospora cinnamomea TaxID=663609 RepID=A0A2U1EZK6_9PSEU|nr:CDP-alcohol phosphatidyltransferase family protein [Actinomycetospora cinnamomea]PVZ05355.1 CDP-diacylglycerol--glycerol-3-phosphate 3-phosphatidyltransferase [Actinomycetospora cinnamomea]